MRANRIPQGDIEAQTRSALTASVERQNERSRLETAGRKKPAEQDALFLRDEAGVCWRLTITALGVLRAEAVKEEPVEEPRDGRQATGK